MTDPIEELLDIEADKQALIDEITEDRAYAFRERYSELLESVEERDEGLWSEFVSDITITLADYEDVPVIDRGYDWLTGLSAMLAAVKQQAWLEVYGVDLIEIAENEGRKIERQVNQMQKSDLKAAATKGVGKSRFQVARDRRQSAR